MRAPRFFVDAPLEVGSALELPANAAHHALRVLRMQGGDELVLFNGRGGEFAARLLPGRGARQPAAEVLGFEAIEREPALRITLVQSLIAQDRLDWVIEKAVELGVARLIIAAAARSVVRLETGRLERRLARWSEIVVNACCQCGRNRVPALEAATSMPEALAIASAAPPAGSPPSSLLILDPGAGRPLGPGPRNGTVACAVGPEGGFTADELQAARAAGFTPIALGPRVLRSETAGLVVSAALLATGGESGPPLPLAGEGRGGRAP